VIKLIGLTENLENGQLELKSSAKNLVKGQVELLTGQKQLSTRIENVEKGQDILSTGQNEIKELIKHTTTQIL
jgi:exonuclease VII small subunit